MRLQWLYVVQPLYGFEDLFQHQRLTSQYSEVVKLISPKTLGIRALYTSQQKHWVMTREESQMVDMLESQRQS
jgi:hypothetical protein